MGGAALGAQREAKEEEHDDAPSKAFGGDDVTSAVPEFVSYARAELFVSNVKSSEGQTDDDILFAIVGEPYAMLSKEATSVNFRRLRKPMVLARRPSRRWWLGVA